MKYVGWIGLPSVFFILTLVASSYGLALGQNQSIGQIESKFNMRGNWTGSVDASTEIQKLIISLTGIDPSQAMTNAINEVGTNSFVGTVSQQIDRGYLVYYVIIVDPNNVPHFVIVDAGDGKILTNQPLLSNSSSIMTSWTKSNTMKGIDHTDTMKGSEYMEIPEKGSSLQ